MSGDEDIGHKNIDFQLGQSLYTASIGEIREWIEMLQSEITRLELEINKKQADQQAAESLFKKM